MKEYEVIVHTQVREVYYVEAESREEALQTWSGVEVEMAECVGIDDIEAREAPE